MVSYQTRTMGITIGIDMHRWQYNLVLKGVKKTKEHTFLGSKCELEKTLSYFNGDVDGKEKLWRVRVRHTHT